MITLAAKLLRHRAGPAVATLIALAVGVLILTAMGTLVESGLRFHPAPQLYRTADAVIANREVSYTFKEFGGDPTTATAPLPEGTVDAKLVEKIRQLPGVTAVAGDDRIIIDSPSAIGHGFQMYGFTGAPQLAPPRADDEVVADVRLGAAPGDTLKLSIDGTVRRYRVSATADTGAAQVFFTGAEAARLSAHPGRYDSIGVRTSDPSALPGAYTGRHRGEAEQSGSLAARSLLIEAGSAFGGYVIMLIVFVVAGTIGLSVRHRRRDLALLRAVAATPGQLRRMLMAETALLSLIAAVLGVPSGLLAARWTHGQLIDRGFIPAGFPLAAGALASLAAVAIAVLVAVLAALIAGRRVTRIKPVEALGEIAVEPKRSGVVRLTFGVLTLIGAGSAGAFTAALGNATAALASAVGMLYLFVIAVALLAPWINALSARLLTPLLTRVWRASGYLAAKNLRANAQGMATVLTALVLSVGFGGSVWFLQNNLARQTTTQARVGTLADRVVVGGAASSLRGLGGVTTATGVWHTSVIVKSFDGIAPLTAQALDGSSSTMDLDVVSGNISDISAKSVAVSTMQGAHVGDTLQLWLADGAPASLKVVAVYRRGLGFGDVTLASATVAGHLPRSLEDEVLVRTGPGGDASLAAWSAGHPGSAVLDTASRTQQISTDLAIGAWLNRLLIGVMVGYAALAASTTMVMAALARRRELALLQLVGVTRRQLRRMVNAEQAGLLGAAVLIGAAIAALTLGAIVRALTGSPIPYIPPLGWVAVLGGITALALVSTIWPVRRMLRTPPIENIGTKE
jgi:putative ABC transport system permease protein